MRYRTTLILLVLASTLLGVFLFYALRQPALEDYRTLEARVFAREALVLPPGVRLRDRVTGLTLRYGEQVIVLARNDDVEWRLAMPIQTIADGDAVARVLDHLEALTAVRVLTAGPGERLELSEFGLDKPSGMIALDMGAPSATLLLGARTADDRGVYAMRPDARSPLIYVLPREIAALAAQPVEALRDGRLLPVRGPFTRLIVREADGLEMELHRATDGWRMVAPVEDAADFAAVEILLAILSDLRVAPGDFLSEGVAAADLPRLGLEPPRRRITLSGDGASATLLLGSEAVERSGHRYVMREGELALGVIAADKTELLALRATDLRSRRAMRFNPQDVRALEIDSEKPVRLARQTGWSFSDSGESADEERVGLFLKSLAALEVKDWVDGPSPERVAEAGLTAPRAVLRVTLSDGSTHELRLGERALGMRLHARRGPAGPILLVPDTLLPAIEAGREAFMAKASAADPEGETR